MKDNKTIETKVDTPRDAKSDVLDYFCITNSENIVACGWYNTDFCMKNCKFYRTKVEGASENSTNAK